MEIHHTKHHQAYIDKLNDALAGYPTLAAKPLTELLPATETLPEDIRAAVRNHGGGHYNHSFFWTLMTSSGRSEPQGELAGALSQAFGSVDKFKEDFSNAAAKHFGSGWAWLTVKPGPILEVISLPNQDAPIMSGRRPLLGLDIWEHAYYLKYQNKRLDYIAAWWNVVNWPEVEKYYELYK